MNEGLRNIALLLWALCAVNTNSYANDNQVIIAEEAGNNAPTLVYGAAKRPNGSKEQVLVRQPAGSGNPLGDPIVIPKRDSLKTLNAAPAANSRQKAAPGTINGRISGSGNEVNAPRVIGQPVVNQPTLGQEFQNTLEEANGRIYDVQSYPVEDVKAIGNPSQPETIYSPNVNPGNNG